MRSVMYRLPGSRDTVVRRSRTTARLVGIRTGSATRDDAIDLSGRFSNDPKNQLADVAVREVRRRRRLWVR
jgi:hypothetical protein